MNDPIRVLVVEDRPAEATLIVAELHRPGVELEWKRVETESDYLVQLTRGWQIILAGDQVPQLAVVRALELLKARRLDIPFVVLTDGEYGYDDALNQGASDCVQRRFGRLGHVVRRELRNAAERQWRKTEVSVTKSVMERLLQSEVGGNPIYDILAEIKQAADFEAVGVRIRQGDDFPYYQTIGFPDVFVKSEESLCSRDSAGYPVRDEQGNHVMDCLCGDVLAGRFDPSSTFFTKGGSLWCNRTSQLPASMTAATSTPRRNVCVHMGYESLALIPLRRGDQIFGLMQFNDHRPDRFTLEMTEFFERLGSTIGIALDRQLKQEALLESREELLLALGG
ncbi:MAG: GAF domain-containing protein, partial [Acidobacteriota bacterium]